MHGQVYELLWIDIFQKSFIARFLILDLQFLADGDSSEMKRLIKKFEAQ